MKKHFILITIVLTSTYYSQIIKSPLVQESWTGGLAGNLSWDNYSESNTTDYKGFNFDISSRNGRFVLNNLSVGFDIQWRQKTLDKTATSKITHTEKEKIGFIGLWSRYYLNINNSAFYIFPEVSAGYAAIKFEDSQDFQTATADGFGLNAGLGAGIFLTSSVAFEITARYQFGNLTGNVEKNSDVFDYSVNLNNFNLLFGFQIYLK